MWRNHHLLGLAESIAEQLGPVTVLVVYHPLDNQCAQAVDGYRELLQNHDQPRPVDIGAFYAAVCSTKLTEHDAKRINEFGIRYLDLHLSTALEAMPQQS